MPVGIKTGSNVDLINRFNVSGQGRYGHLTSDNPTHAMNALEWSTGSASWPFVPTNLPGNAGAEEIVYDASCALQQSIKNNTPGRQASVIDFSRIDKMYTYIDPENESAVKAFITERQPLLSIIESAPKHIKALFGDSPLLAQLISDPDASEHKLLAIYIGASVSPKDASDKLDELFLSEWGNQLDRVSDFLFLSVKFR